MEELDFGEEHSYQEIRKEEICDILGHLHIQGLSNADELSEIVFNDFLAPRQMLAIDWQT